MTGVELMRQRHKHGELTFMNSEGKGYKHIH